MSLSQPAGLHKSPKNLDAHLRPGPLTSASKHHNGARSISSEAPRNLGQIQSNLVVPKIDLTPIDKYRTTMAEAGQNRDDDDQINQVAGDKMENKERSLDLHSLGRSNQRMPTYMHQKNEKKSKRNATDQRWLSSGPDLPNFDNIND